VDPVEGRTDKQDWSSYYVNSRSDVDFVVEMRSGASPTAVAQRLMKKGSWRLVGQIQVPKFASTQFTLVGKFDDKEDTAAPEAEKKEEEKAKEEEESEKEKAEDEHCKDPTRAGEGQVFLDVTCIEQPLHFKRFQRRQEAFRNFFSTVRSKIEQWFDWHGALAFDSYIHLLKAFARKVNDVQGNVITGFQATCLGLFVVQIGHFRCNSQQSIALALFEGFLRFCVSFFGDTVRPPGMPCWPSYSYRHMAIDLSGDGRWLPRMNSSWLTECYFMAAEVNMKTRPDERVNITHSLDPRAVSIEAHNVLERAFSQMGNGHSLDVALARQ
jgi:hypothetical protein